MKTRGWYAVECDECASIGLSVTPDISYLCPSCTKSDYAQCVEDGRYYPYSDLYYWHVDRRYHLTPQPVGLAKKECGFTRDATTSGWCVGVELECYTWGMKPTDAKELLESALPGQVVVSGDRSLGEDGIEIQTAPLPFLQTARILKKIYELIPVDLTDNCGMHVNLSHESITNYKPLAIAMRDLVAKQEMYSLYGREPNTYCRLGVGVGYKYSVVRADSNRVEFRLPAPDESLKVTLRRISNAIRLAETGEDYVQQHKR